MLIRHFGAMWSGTVRLLAYVTLVLMSSASFAAAEQDDTRFSLSIGAFITDRDSEARADASNRDLGTVIDLEDDLGLDGSDTVLRLDGFYRFADKHRIDFSVFDLSRSASKQVEREFSWKDTTFVLNTNVESDFNLSIYKVAYTWSFLKKEQGFLGATAGLYVADIGARLDAPLIGAREVGEVTAPLPVVGLRGQYRFAERWALRASGEFFFLEYGDYDGSLVDLLIGLEFDLSKNIDVGIGANSVRLDIEVDRDVLHGAFDWEYDGVLAYLKFDF